MEKTLQDEEKHLAISRQKLGPTAQLVSSTERLYSFLGEVIDAISAPEDLHEMVLSVARCGLACSFRFVMAINSAFRGHLSEAIASTRGAIEQCGFAARIRRHPHLARVWLDAGLDEEHYEKYRTKFGPSKLFPADNVVLTELYSRYDLCSKLSHPSIYSVGGQFKPMMDQGVPTLTFEFFDSKSDDEKEPAATLLWVVDTHYGIIKVLLSTLEDLSGFSDRTRDEELAKFQAHLDYEKKKWEPILLKTEKPHGA